MDHLINYVIETDKTFKEFPFNEIDAALYTLITYIDFKDLVNPMTIKDYYAKNKTKFQKKLPIKFYQKNHELFISMAKSKRFQDNILSNYKCILNEHTQFGAITITVPHQFKYIAFEGTDENLIGWKEDFEMSYKYPILAQEYAIKYVKDNINFKDILVYVGGHSKGGALSITAAMESNFNKRWRIKYIFNFDGPGFTSNILNGKKYNKIEKKIRSYHPEGTIVGMMMENKGIKKYVKSSALMFSTHFPHSWKWNNNHFEYGELSKSSKDFKKLNANFLKIDSKKREKINELLFTILFSSGYTKYSELKKLDLNRFSKIAKETFNLKEEDKKLLFEAFKMLIMKP